MIWILALIGCGVLVGLDQLTKFWAVTSLKPIGSRTVISGLLDFTFVENRGAAFGILKGQRWFFIALTAVMAVAIVVAFYKLPRTRVYHWLRFSMVVLLSGALGNVIDRIFRGYVVDFLEVTFINFPVFNLADIYVVCSTFLIMILILFFIKEEH